MEQYYAAAGQQGSRQGRMRIFGGSGLGTKRLWYAALIPLLAIYIELYANSIAFGAMVWVLTLISGPAACLLDRRYIEKKGVDVTPLRKTYTLLPPLYIYKRTTLTGDSYSPAIVWVVMAFYAIFMNGFTSAMMIDEQDMTDAIRSSYWSSIENMDDVYADRTIEDTLKEMAGAELFWSGERSKGSLDVSCHTADKRFDAEFSLVFDGYIVTSHRLISITENGRTLEGDAAADRIREELPEETESSAGSDTDNSSDTDTNNADADADGAA